MSSEEQTQAPKRGCAAALGLALVLPAAALGFAWFSQGLSWWSAALASGLGLMALGLLTLPPSRRLVAAGALLVLGPWLVRAWWVRGSEQTRLTTLPDDSGPGLLGRLYPEADGTLAAAGFIRRADGFPDPEAEAFSSILRAAYERTKPSAALQPTPAIATYLGLQGPSGFETIVIRPPEQRVVADGAVIFLHGFAGNFYVYCWEVAQAAGQANLLTLCPSTGPSGAWWEPNGEQIVEATLRYAHDIGMNRVYLAGLSNGAAGASVLANKFSGRLAGLILVSGQRAEQPPRLPVLVVQGSLDQAMPASLARAYAARGSNVTYREIAGGHFIFLSKYETVRPVIAQFLSTLEKTATAPPRR